MVLMICLTTLPVVTVTWIATNNTRHSVEQEMVSANISRMEWANQYLNELIEQLNILFYTVQINTQLMDSLQQMDNPNSSVQFNIQKYIGDTLTSVFYSNSRKIDDFTLYIHENKKAVSVNHVGRFISFMEIETGPWSRMITTPTNIYFKKEDERIYAFHTMNRFEDQELLGGLSVRINRKVWDEVGKILESESDSSVFLSNDEGELLSGTKNEIETDVGSLLNSLHVPDSGLSFQKTDKYYFFMQKVNNGKLTLVKAIPIATINRSAQATINAGIVTGSFFVAASVILSILFSLRISKPIISLARTMRTTDIQSFAMKTVNNRDEIGLLEHGYNSMMKRLKDLVEVEYQGRIDIKTAQLKTLQAQINPHFLNNTLHLIGGMALEKNVPEIYRVIRVIGDLLRYSISLGNDLVSFSDELKHMQNYLFIQEQRFIGRCQVVLEYEKMSSENMLPKFTLQPIVENAFEHGLQKKEGNWSVEIRIKRIGKRIFIAVQDDGVGMEEEKLNQIRKELRSGTDKNTRFADEDQSGIRKSIGLKNVDSRMKLHYGERSGLRIYSKQGKGTLVLIVLPILEKEVLHHV